MYEPIVENAGAKSIEANMAVARKALVELFKTLFTKSSIESNMFLLSQLSADLKLSVEAVFNMPQVLEITNDRDLVRDALAFAKGAVLTDSVLQIKLEQLTIILRNVSSSAADDAVRAIFTSVGAPEPSSVRGDVEDSWFVTFASEEDTLSALDAIKGATFEGKSVKVRLKSESIIRTRVPNMASPNSQTAAASGYMMQPQYFMGAPVPFGFPGAYGMPQVGQPNIGFPIGIYPPAVGTQQLPSPSTRSMAQGFSNASPNRQHIQPGVRISHHQQQQSQGPNNRRRQHPYNNMGEAMFPHDQMIAQQMQMSTEEGILLQEQEGSSMLQVIRDVGFPQQQLQQQLRSSNEGAHTQHRKNGATNFDRKANAASGGKKRGDSRTKNSDNNKTHSIGDKKGKERETTHYSLESDFPALADDTCVGSSSAVQNRAVVFSGGWAAAVAGKKPLVASVASVKSPSENLTEVQVRARNNTETEEKSTQLSIAIGTGRSDTQVLGQQRQSHEQAELFDGTKESTQQPTNPCHLVVALPEDFNVEFGSFGNSSFQNEFSGLVEGVRRHPPQSTSTSGEKPSFLDIARGSVNK